MLQIKKHDLNLGKWGPYNKKYLGACHIADEMRGATMNVELFPGFFRRAVMVSPSICDNGLKMWGANPELTHFCYRYELQWKDKVYCDADFVISDDKRCDIACTFVNNTDSPQSVNLNLCTSLQLPEIKQGGVFLKYRTVCKAILPEKCNIIDAVNYDRINCSEILASDGRCLGEEILDYATGYGSSVGGAGFFSHEHFVRYNIENIQADSLGIRYISKKDTALRCILNDEHEYIFRLDAAKEFNYAYISFGEIVVNTIELRPTGKGVTLDCLCFGYSTQDVIFEDIPHNIDPEMTVTANGIKLKYEGIDSTYTVQTCFPIQKIRKLYCADVGYMLQQRIHDHVSEVLEGVGEGVYSNILTEPLYLGPGEKETVCFTITNDDVEKTNISKDFYCVKANPDGEKYMFSQNMMAYNTFLNVVYPIYTRRQYIRHNTPGRYWDCLYSWDSGFIGMGLATASFSRAFDCLNTYLTPVDDMHSPYIFHGSVVPTQIFLYKYLLDKYPEHKTELKELYPMVKQFYKFYAHMDNGDEQMNSGLLKPWHIFYNSGGWDDYPPQKFLQQESRREGRPADYTNTTPVITTAVTILIAKMMKMISDEFGLSDFKEFDADIRKYSGDVINQLWDDECGYFSYMVHDRRKNAKEFLRAPDGSNFNMGFDGIFPYIAGVTNEIQSKRIIENISKGLMTSIGVGVVDVRASYYSKSGYWNGSVWMPHQWILWKALLDKGETCLAKEIADKALNLWKNEVDDTYCCFEHFMSANGRGCGFHQFSGLSTPVLMFFEAYYSPGTITLGFTSLIKYKKWNKTKTAVECECAVENDKAVAIICMTAGDDYKFTVNGCEVIARKVSDGAYEIPLKKGICRIVGCNQF